MSKIVVQPMPKSYLKFSMKYRPCCPPVFPEGNPTVEDIRLAKKLFRALDPESQDWYKYNTTLFRDE